MVYKFIDFLPLAERVAGVVVQPSGKQDVVWVMAPQYGTANQTQVQFREPGNSTTWSSDIWERRATGPLDIPHAYLISHVARQEASDGSIVDNEFKITQFRSRIHRYIGGQWYVSEVGVPGACGIPYCRLEWQGVPLLHIMDSWYHVWKHDMSEPGRYVYHWQQIRHDPQQQVHNPYYNESRPTLELSEAYWQHSLVTGEKKWYLGHGDEDANGEPTGDNVQPGRVRHHAYASENDTGVMTWRMHNSYYTSHTWSY